MRPFLDKASPKDISGYCQGGAADKHARGRNVFGSHPYD